MIKLYGRSRSRALRNVWLLEELGLPYEQVHISPYSGETRDPHFLAINPNGHVPVLEDQGTVLFESLAINLYLAEQYGPAHGAGLWPATAADHGRCYQWSVWAMTELEPSVYVLLSHRVNLPEAERNEAAAQQAEVAAQASFRVLEGALADRDYLLGDTFTVADLNVSIIADWGVRSRVPMEPFPRMQAWFTRCTDRPAFKKAWATREAA